MAHLLGTGMALNVCQDRIWPDIFYVISVTKIPPALPIDSGYNKCKEHS